MNKVSEFLKLTTTILPQQCKNVEGGAGGGGGRQFDQSLTIETTGRRPWCIRVHITAVTSTFFSFAGLVYI